MRVGQCLISLFASGGGNTRRGELSPPRWHASRFYKFSSISYATAANPPLRILFARKAGILPADSFSDSAQIDPHPSLSSQRALPCSPVLTNIAGQALCNSPVEPGKAIYMHIAPHPAGWTKNPRDAARLSGRLHALTRALQCCDASDNAHCLCFAFA